jgi:hypothetical protein
MSRIRIDLYSILLVLLSSIETQITTSRISIIANRDSHTEKKEHNENALTLTSLINRADSSGCVFLNSAIQLHGQTSMPNHVGRVMFFDHLVNCLSL